MTIVVTAISKNNAGLPMLGSCDWGDCCCVAGTGTFSGSAAAGTFDGYTEDITTNVHPFETCWQAYEGDLSDNKPLNQYCWTKAYSISKSGRVWQACKPAGSWKPVMDGRAPGNTCGDPCGSLDNAC